MKGICHNTVWMGDTFACCTLEPGHGGEHKMTGYSEDPDEAHTWTVTWWETIPHFTPERARLLDQSAGVNGDEVVSHPTHGAGDALAESKGQVHRLHVPAPADPRVDLVASALTLHPDASPGFTVTEAQVVAVLDALDASRQ